MVVSRRAGGDPRGQYFSHLCPARNKRGGGGVLFAEGKRVGESSRKREYNNNGIAYAGMECAGNACPDGVVGTWKSVFRQVSSFRNCCSSARHQHMS
jgi:hypothetical protein